MTILRDFFGQPIQVGNRVAYVTHGSGGSVSRPTLGTVKAIRLDCRPGRPDRVFATIEREVSGIGWPRTTKLACHEFDMTHRPVFKAPEEVAEDAPVEGQLDLLVSNITPTATPLLGLLKDAAR